MNRASVGGTGEFQDPAQLHDQEGHRVRVQAIDICSFVCSLTSTVRERSIKHPSQQNRMSAEGLKAYQPSYMLLPNFNFCPDGPIQLGTIIPAIKGGDLPDPNRPKNSTFRVPVEASLINGKRDFKPWTFDSRRDVKNKPASHCWPGSAVTFLARDRMLENSRSIASTYASSLSGQTRDILPRLWMTICYGHWRGSSVDHRSTWSQDSWSPMAPSSEFVMSEV
jgi:hypothetical protein